MIYRLLSSEVCPVVPTTFKDLNMIQIYSVLFYQPLLSNTIIDKCNYRVRTKARAKPKACQQNVARLAQDCRQRSLFKNNINNNQKTKQENENESKTINRRNILGSQQRNLP